MKKLVAIAGIQTQVSLDLTFNLRKTAKMIARAAKQGAQIVCLQELFRTPYFPQSRGQNKNRFAESLTGETVQTMSKLAKELRVVIIAPFYERAKSGRYYNTAAVFDQRGQLLGSYRKIHIPQDPLFYEKDYFQAGDAGYKIYNTKFAKFAVLICYDQWFPEAARAAALKGAQIIFYPTAIGNIVGQKAKEGDWHEAWETVMRGHAIANGVHIVAVNRVGREGRLNFWGQSFAADSFGRVLKRASAVREEILMAKVDLTRNKLIREGWGFLKNRRPDTYQL